MYKIVKVDDKNKLQLSTRIYNLKSQVTYPLGVGEFNIVHGYNYFSYYERMGEMHYWCMFDKGELIATRCAVIKTIDSKKICYLCDLKVAEEYRGQGIARRLFRRVFFYMLLRRRIYRLLAISMDDSKGLAYKKIAYMSSLGTLSQIL